MSALATYVGGHEDDEDLIMMKVNSIYLWNRTNVQPRLLWWISILHSGTLRLCMVSGQGYYLREVLHLVLGLERRI